jgi:hypothetical protein
MKPRVAGEQGTDCTPRAPPLTPGVTRNLEGVPSWNTLPAAAALLRPWCAGEARLPNPCCCPRRRTGVLGTLKPACAAPPLGPAPASAVCTPRPPPGALLAPLAAAGGPQAPPVGAGAPGAPSGTCWRGAGGPCCQPPSGPPPAAAPVAAAAPAVGTQPLLPPEAAPAGGAMPLLAASRAAYCCAVGPASRSAALPG